MTIRFTKLVMKEKDRLNIVGDTLGYKDQVMMAYVGQITGQIVTIANKKRWI